MKTQTAEKLTFKLPDLPYPANALEPHLDEATMKIHHDRYHAAYVENLDKALEKAEVHDSSLEGILRNISNYSAAVRNNAGGHYNHSLFWKIFVKGRQTRAGWRIG